MCVCVPVCTCMHNHMKLSVCSVYNTLSGLYLWGFSYSQFFIALQKNVNFSPQPSDQYNTEQNTKIQQKLSLPSPNIRCHHDNLL